MTKILFLTLFTLNFTVFAQDSLVNSKNLPEIVLTKTKSISENEKPPIFPEGAIELRNILAKNFRTDKISGSTDIHCDLFFIVNKEGNIIEIKASGTNEEFNNEAIFALSQIKQKWIPATLNGIPVNYKMKIPLDMKFEDDKDVKARFPAGEEAFKKMITDNLKLKDTYEEKSCIISFVVENNGRISKIRTEGTDKTFNKNVEKAVSKIKERWIPKFLRGLPVASKVKITFKIN